MKKLILALATVAFIGIGGSAVSAQTTTNPKPLPTASLPLPIECRESSAPGGARTVDINNDGKADIPATCVNFYVAPPIVAVQPPATTTTVPVTVPAGELPRTGSGVSPILGIGALLLVGGGIVVVATRRRSTSSSPT